MSAPGVRTVLATARYEALIALRTKALWWSLLPLTALALLLAATSGRVVGASDPVRRVAETSLVFSLLCTLGIAVGLAGRLAGHRRSGLTDLLDATAAGIPARVAGSLLGSLLVALVPPVCGFLLLVVVTSISTGTPAAVGAGLLAIVVVLLPASLMLSSFAAMLGVLLPVAAARVLTAVFWLWATVLNPMLLPVPTATGTVLSPLARYPAAAWLHASPASATYGLSGALRPEVHSATATAQVLCTLAASAVFLAVAAIRLNARTRVPNRRARWMSRSAQ